jgi:hypothetical protein
MRRTLEKKEKRERENEEGEAEKDKKEITMVTWNLQRISMRERNRE